ncbi:hypothetical protein FISHEDRAFT_43478 [Fistulina hepatica ATCC 64428]|uniref:DUF7702 domain-containing protein n=1 Tax=Fistulina hepatica ATCC 64428 TaxID=1128425 RepID=A0A0D7ACJ3_9AGAR|nr:hypothetical protein FISHEDRAFT_43478 [Fistulina hepatica ATCC 64428]
MPDLDNRGKIAAAEIAFYAPAALVACALFARYAFHYESGWVFTLLFSSVRIVCGALILAAELSSSSTANLYTAAYVMFETDLGLLLISALGYLGLAGYHTYSSLYQTMTYFRITAFFCLAAMIITAVGGGLQANDPSSKEIKTGKTLRRVGAVLFMVIWCFMVFLHLYAYSFRWEMRYSHRRFLAFLFLAMAFLGVRCVYQILDVWSSADIYGLRLSSNSHIVKFQPVTGDYVTWLVMGLIMEYVAVVIYLAGSIDVVIHRRR